MILKLQNNTISYTTPQATAQRRTHREVHTHTSSPIAQRPKFL